MKISVIVPVYNGEAVLRRCLDSIVEQTYRELEIIIVNDGSTDKTASIIEEYTSKYTNIFAVHKENEGLPQARKTGVDVATGSYFGFVDADDWLEPDMYEELYKACRKYGADISCAGIYMDYEGNKSEVLGNTEELLLDKTEALTALHQRKLVFPYAWNKLYRAELLKHVDYPEGNFVGEDYAIVTQVLEKSEQTAWTGKPLYHYVQTVDSMCRGGYTANYLLAFQSYQNRYVNLTGKFPSLSSCVNNYLLTEYLSFVVAMGKNKNYDKTMIKKIKHLAKKGFVPYITAEYVEIKYKGSIVAFLLNYRLLIAAYRLMSRR